MGPHNKTNLDNLVVRKIHNKCEWGIQMSSYFYFYYTSIDCEEIPTIESEVWNLV